MDWQGRRLVHYFPMHCTIEDKARHQPSRDPGTRAQSSAHLTTCPGELCVQESCSSASHTETQSHSYIHPIRKDTDTGLIS